ncbi:hypothetical protein NLI96_g1697 [Meripilus lineatus]|uniref:Zn(2)-C6 fungal-type domain-containing protein n=1 Tax=Meripilus lineatus TaxID=2056292 RepID=A0AAD5YH81_9APHY|nr:hypothetical protein NLI96_g1697 [Physisporinus lineatus]
MYPTTSPRPHPYASPDHFPPAAQPSFSPDFNPVPSHHHQAPSPSRIVSPSLRHSSESSLAHALDESTIEQHRLYQQQYVQSPYLSHQGFSPQCLYQQPSASPSPSFFEYNTARPFHMEREQFVRDQEMLPISDLSITLPPRSSRALDADDDQEYEDDADCGRDGGPSVSVDQTRGVVDVNGGHTCHHHHPVIIPDQYECECVDEPDDDTMAVGDGGGDPGYMFSPVSSYEYDYDYDIPPCCDGDIVDSPVGGDLTLWGDATPHPGTQYPNDVPRHYSAELPTKSYTLESAITPPPEAPLPTPSKLDNDPEIPPPTEPAAPPRAPRGRPRKNANRHSESEPVPSPKSRPSMSRSPPTKSRPSHSVPPALSQSPVTVPSHPPTLSMDEIPVPDAESKPGQAVFKLTPSTIPGVTSGIPGVGGATGKEGKKKPIMACLFCRERKIACGPPAPGSANPRCNQCVRRGLECEYPKESRRGQHKRGPRAVRVQALTEEREQKSSSSSPSSGSDHPSKTSSSSTSRASSTGSNGEGSIKVAAKRKEKSASNGARSSSKLKGKSAVKKEEGETLMDTGGRRD